MGETSFVGMVGWGLPMAEVEREAPPDLRAEESRAGVPYGLDMNQRGWWMAGYRAALAAREEPLTEAREALRAYVSEYGNCPGIEVEPGVTSGCTGEGDECPTCKAVSDAG